MLHIRCSLVKIVYIVKKLEIITRNTFSMEKMIVNQICYKIINKYSTEIKEMLFWF